jgi:hypothetical protein
VTKDDVLLGYRLRVFALAGEVSVSEACRVMGVHPVDLLPLEGAG